MSEGPSSPFFLRHHTLSMDNDVDAMLKIDTPRPPVDLPLSPLHHIKWCCTCRDFPAYKVTMRSTHPFYQASQSQSLLCRPFNFNFKIIPHPRLNPSNCKSLAHHLPFLLLNTISGYDTMIAKVSQHAAMLLCTSTTFPTLQSSIGLSSQLSHMSLYPPIFGLCFWTSSQTWIDGLNYPSSQSSSTQPSHHIPE